MATAPVSASIDSGPVAACVLVTPADGTNLPDGICRGFLIGAAGIVKITDALDNTSSPSLPAGFIPIRAKRIWSTGTDSGVLSAGIWALY